MSTDMAAAATRFVESVSSPHAIAKERDARRALHLLHELNRVAPGLKAMLENMLDASEPVK